MRNARLDELQAGIKTSRRNINNLRYLDDTSLMAESEEKLKSLIMRVKEESERAGLKLNIKKDRIIASDLIQFSSVTQLCPIIYDPMDCSTSGFPVHHQFPEPTNLMSIMLVMPSNHLILSFPLLLPPSPLPSNRVFSNELVLCNRWPKIWSFSFSISPSMNTQD